jgi:hypothetical protein
MSAHVFGQQFNLTFRRTAESLPGRVSREGLMQPTTTRDASDWLARLAAWAERQPVHHRMGSYMRRV